MRLSHWDGLPQNAEDAQRKFNGTYVYALIDDNNTAKTYKLTWDGRMVSGVYLDANKRERHTNWVGWETVDIIRAYPKVLGAIPVDNTVYFIKRNPARQWQVGLCRANTHLWDVNGRGVPPTVPIISAAYEPEWFRGSVKEAVQALESTKLLEAVALNNRYWLLKCPDKIKLFSGRLPVGSFMFGSFLIHKSCRDLKQELWDDLKIKVA